MQQQQAPESRVAVARVGESRRLISVCRLLALAVVPQEQPGGRAAGREAGGDVGIGMVVSTEGWGGAPQGVLIKLWHRETDSRWYG